VFPLEGEPGVSVEPAGFSLSVPDGDPVPPGVGELVAPGCVGGFTSVGLVVIVVEGGVSKGSVVVVGLVVVGGELVGRVVWVFVVAVVIVALVVVVGADVRVVLE
jgi:hypothetical protein